jgi:hypothetical protein
MDMMPTDPDAILFLEFALGIGLLSLGLGAWLRHRELAPRNWLQVNGTIVASKIDTKPISVHGIARAVCIPVIEYEYRYEEQTFKSSRRRTGNYITGKNIYAEEVISRYPIGSSVTVFINPQKPATSVLEYGTTPMSWIPLGLGIFFTTLSLLPFFLK